MSLAVDARPAIGEIVRVRSRRYLVEAVTLAPNPGDDTLVRLSCLEDDAEGEELEVLWETEVDARRINDADWSKLTKGEFRSDEVLRRLLPDAAVEHGHVHGPKAVPGAVSSRHQA